MQGKQGKITLMESKILELGKAQKDKGYRGGVFTPGQVRNETEYSYRAINMALESLIDRGLVEKMVTSAIRNGSVVELDVYRITHAGLESLESIRSGEVKVAGGALPSPRPPRSEPRKHADAWAARPPEARQWDPQPSSELAQRIRALEDAVRIINADLKAVNANLDKFSAPPPRQAAAMPPGTESQRHRILILMSAEELGRGHKHVLADDLKHLYAERCSALGMKPKGMSQFTPFLKRLEAEGLVSLERVGCKKLGIKGQGSRVVVSTAPAGRELLERQN